MKYLYETHFHTSEVSNCANVAAADAAEMYKAVGYSGVLVTDHFSTDCLTNSYQGKNWKEKIDYFLKGYHEAKKHETENFSVMLGMEIRFDESDNDYLVFGADEDFLYKNEWMTKLSLKQFRKLALENNLSIVQAHPFRINMTTTNPRYLDGIEVFNGNRRHDSANEIAEMWAERSLLLKTSGSDFHELEDLARGGVYSDIKIGTSKEFRSALLAGRLEPKKPY